MPRDKPETPVVLPHDPAWASGFMAEADALRLALGPAFAAVHHIGSTAVPGLPAKPILDILLEVTELRALDARRAGIEALGYEALGAYGIRGRRYFRKAQGGVRSHHVHAFRRGSPHVARHLAVRDYLRAFPDVAAAYGQLKQALAAARVDWDGYCAGKDPFVTRVEREALDWARTRQASPGGS